MKVKDLIAELQKADPSGEAEVAIDNKTVFGTTGVEPGYYDGTYLKVHFSESARSHKNCYEIIAVEMGAQIKKINLLYLSAEDAFLENPDAEWIPNRYNPQRDKEFLESVEKWREEGKKLRAHFQELDKENG